MSLTKTSYSMITGAYVNVLDYGADATGITNSQVAIQNAITEGAYNKKAVYFPSGTYRIDSPLIWDKPINLIGEGSASLNFGPGNGSVLKAGAAMSAMLLGSATPGDQDLTQGTTIECLSFDGNNLANYAIYGLSNHSTFRRFTVTKTLVCGISVAYGWCNLFDDLAIQRNSGDGLDVETLSGESNATLISQVKVYLNDGVGMRLGKATNLKVQNCTIETNKKAGIVFGYGSRGFSIDTCYFERNGENGYQFAAPGSEFVRADIIFNGAGPDVYGYGTVGVWDCAGWISGCSTYSDYVNSFIWANRMNNVVINNNIGINGNLPIMKHDLIYTSQPNTNIICNNNGFYSYLFPNNTYGMDIYLDSNYKYKIDYNLINIFSLARTGESLEFGYPTITGAPLYSGQTINNAQGKLYTRAYQNSGSASYASISYSNYYSGADHWNTVLALQPEDGSVGIGTTTPGQRLDVNGAIQFKPGTSAIPTANGYVTIELSDDSTLHIRARGNDGVVRSISFTLS